MTAVSWQILVQVREAGERGAQHQVSRDAQTVAVTGHRLFAAQCDWMSSRQAGLQHRQALQRAADEGRATVAALRHGAHWDQALAQRLIEEESGRNELATTALNVVETVLKVAQAWAARGEKRFEAVVARFFRFGLTIVEQYRPDQLVPYIKKSLPAVGNGCEAASIAAHEAAVEALAKVWRGLEGEGFAAINTARLDVWIETLRGLRFAGGRLRELREAAAAARSAPAVG